MIQPEAFMKSQNMATILGENVTPVARMRLFSRGMQLNNRLYRHDGAQCDKGCLACGNCIDACPVVREKRRFEFLQNRRTSMSLENIVGDECRRCYRCVRACPQVSTEVKEFVWGFRRAEKFIHACLASFIFTLMTTGIFLYHYKDVIPGWQGLFIGKLHFIVGLLLAALPFIYLKVDKTAFLRQLRKAWKFQESDRAWLSELKQFLRHPLRDPLPAWTEFNPYHKAWICYLTVALPILALTGIGNFLGEPVLGGAFYAVITGIHSFVALCTDLLIFLHLYFKLLRFLFRNIGDMYRNYKKNKNFQYTFMYAKNETQLPRATHGPH